MRWCSQHLRAAGAAVVLAFLGLGGLAGCGPAGPTTYPVRGKVELAGGDPRQLAGSNVEAALESDRTVRASGVIQPDGTFTLETLHAGVLRKGALAGTYRVRLILSDDDARSKRSAVLAPRYLQFEKSGLSLKVPADGDVVLKVSSR